MDVTAAVFYQDNRILLMRRGQGHSYAGGWEYPGGKVEPGESGEACIRRELHEELGIDAEIGVLMAQWERPEPGEAFRLRAYRVLSYQGEITLTDHDRMEWVPLERLTEHEQLPADLELSRQIAQVFSTRNRIVQELEQLQDKPYAQFQRKLLPTVSPERVIGVRTPELRRLAKRLDAAGEGRDFLLALPHETFDENQLHAFLISRIPDFEACVQAVETFLPYIDNWAGCDQLSPKVFGRNTPLLLPHVKAWLQSPLPYTVRFGMGMLMQHYLEDDFRPEYPAMVAAVDSGEYYVQMMQAWYFATALAKQYDAIVPYLEQGKLSRWVHNKTIQKAVESLRIDPERKAYLKTLRRKG